MTEAEQRIFDRLKRAEDVRQERFKFVRTVYAYRKSGYDTITDNLLLLPRATELAHPDYLRHQLGMIGVEHLTPFKDFSLVLIGHFNVQNFQFTRCTEKVVLSFNEVIEALRKVNTK